MVSMHYGTAFFSTGNGGKSIFFCTAYMLSFDCNVSKPHKRLYNCCSALSPLVLCHLGVPMYLHWGVMEMVVQTDLRHVSPNSIILRASRVTGHRNWEVHDQPRWHQSAPRVRKDGNNRFHFMWNESPDITSFTACSNRLNMAPKRKTRANPASHSQRRQLHF